MDDIEVEIQLCEGASLNWLDFGENDRIDFNHVVLNECFRSVKPFELARDEFPLNGKLLTLAISFDCPDLFLEHITIGNEIYLWFNGSMIGRGSIRRIIDLSNHLELIRSADLTDLIPTSKFHVERVARLELFGFPRLNSHLGQLLSWLQDLNWPVALPICKLLRNSGPEIIPELRRILRSSDSEWIYYTVTSLLPFLIPSIQAELLFDIKRYLETGQAGDYQEDIERFIQTVG